jgi:tripartite-type tricarboxylate transporter receptor subunit TctC
MFRNAFFQIVIAVVSCVAAPIASSQTAYPKYPVRIVVPYSAGGATDTATRVFAQGLGKLLGQPFIIDNRPGGGTNIAASIVAHSAPDGYTLYVANFASHGVNKWLFKQLTYDPDKDFVAASIMVQGPMFLIVNPSLPVNSVQELVALAKSRPGKLNYASVGIGSPNHIAGELFRMQTNIDVVHVPYKGAAEADRDLLSGRIDFMFDATAMTHVHAGELKALAVAYSNRWPTEPDIPSMAELGFPGVLATTFFALVAPANTPISVLDKLNEASRVVAQQPETAAILMPIGLLPSTASRTEAVEFLREQGTKWKPVVESSGATVD